MNKESANIFLTDSDYSCTDKSFLYLLWFQPSLWWMVLTKEKLDIILDSRYIWKLKNIDEDNIRNIIWNDSLQINYIESQNAIDEIVKLTRKKSELIIEWKVASEYAEKIRKKSGKKLSILKWGYLSQQREQKNEIEQQNIIKAIEIIDDVFLEILKLVKSKEIIWKTELQIRALIINKIFELDWEWESFNSIIAFWPNSAIPHHTTWNTIIWNWPLLIDMWALYNWYSSDFTRTIWVWEKNEEYEEFINYYKIVKQSHEIAFENTQLWMTWKKIDSLARDYIKEKWAWNFFTHWLWHWVWLNIHESPKINQRSTKKIKDNMIFTIEPGIYLEWKFWIRLEDIAFMEEWKLKKYSKVPLKAIF